MIIYIRFYSLGLLLPCLPCLLPYWCPEWRMIIYRVLNLFCPACHASCHLNALNKIIIKYLTLYYISFSIAWECLTHSFYYFFPRDIIVKFHVNFHFCFTIGALDCVRQSNKWRDTPPQLLIYHREFYKNFLFYFTIGTHDPHPLKSGGRDFNKMAWYIPTTFF